MDAKKIKAVGIFSVVMAVSGLFSYVFLPYYGGEYSNYSWYGEVGALKQYTRLFSEILSPVSLGLTNDILNHFPVWNFIFYMLMLFGAIRFLMHKGEDDILLRFSFGVVFLANSFYIFMVIWDRYMDWFLLDRDAIPYEIPHFTDLLILNLISLFSIIFFIWFSYRVLKLLGRRSALEIDTTDENCPLLVEPPKLQRFYHLVIDTVIMLLLLVPMLLGPLRFYAEHVDSLRQFTQHKEAFYVIFFIFQLLFYFVCEAFLHTTPGKLLTRTRVVHEDPSYPLTKGRVALRTICRTIPFNPLSFVFAWVGWHDSVSRTRVVKEVEQKHRPNFGFIVVFVLFSLGFYYLPMLF